MCLVPQSAVVAGYSRPLENLMSKAPFAKVSIALLAILGLLASSALGQTAQKPHTKPAKTAKKIIAKPKPTAKPKPKPDNGTGFIPVTSPGPTGPGHKKPKHPKLHLWKHKHRKSHHKSSSKKSSPKTTSKIAKPKGVSTPGKAKN